MWTASGHFYIKKFFTAIKKNFFTTIKRNFFATTKKKILRKYKKKNSHNYKKIFLSQFVFVFVCFLSWHSIRMVRLTRKENNTNTKKEAF